MFDLIIHNGLIVDGSGNPSFAADLAVQQSKIAAIGTLPQADARKHIDAAGKYVTPGFIDTHSHADCSLFLYPNCDSYLRQGITTFIGGQCGDSNAPIYRYWMRKYWEYDFWQDIDPYIFEPRTVQPVEKVLPVVRDKTGYDIRWRSFGEYAQVLRDLGLGCNLITLAGHSQIRADVMGPDGQRPPTAEEMRQIKVHLEEALLAGAWGFSTGRDYPPSAWAEWPELLELACFVRERGGYYFTHWRRTGPRQGTPGKANKLAGIVEALDLALAAGIKTQISHLTTGFEVYPESSALERFAAETTLSVIDDYIARGADVAFDVIPGVSGGICIQPYLASLFMPWIRMAGSLEQFRINLRAEDYCRQLLQTLASGRWYNLNPLLDPDWDDKIFVLNSEIPDYSGHSLRQLATQACLPSLEMIPHLLREQPRLRIRREGKTQAEVQTLLGHARACVCTDTYAFDLVGLYGNQQDIAELLPHPHTYCAFPKFILEYGGSIEAAIRQITARPAEFLGIDGRGYLREGYFADIVMLDPARLASKESYIEPRVYPEGIDLVLVNGEIAVDGQGITGVRNGLLLRK